MASEIDAMSAFRGGNVTPEVAASLAARGLVSVGEPIRNDSRVELTPTGRQVLDKQIPRRSDL